MKAAQAATFLFVPGDRPERFAKAAECGADAVIIDLEDAVAPAAKDAARQAAKTYLEAGGRALVRVNARDTAWFAEDVAAVAAPGLAGVMLPKAEDAETLASLSARLPGVALVPLVETAAGFAGLARIAAAPGVARLAFGSIDFQLDLGIEGERDELLYFRSRLVLESRLAGIAAPVDGVTVSIDGHGVGADSTYARRLGFGGKLCIHPRQVPVVAAAFTALQADLDRARRIVEAVSASGGGAVSLDGRMIDRPVIDMARALLERHDARTRS